VKILHTSDWHLGARIGRVDRADDAFARITELTEAIDTEQVDLLLVAGDVFDETRTLLLGGLVRRLASLLAPRIADGLRAVFLAGNHDREPVFALLQAANDLFGPGAADQVMFVQRPELLQVPSRDGTEAVALACVPYPTHFRYDLETRGWPSRDVRNRELADAVRTRIAELAEDAATRLAALPTVMAGHLLIRNAKIGRGSYCLTEAEDVPIERGDLPAWDYIALGHIHKPQDMGHPNIRYSGSIERMDLGEADDTKSAVIVEVNERGSARHRIVPLDATPFASIQATSEADLLARQAELADAGRTLVSLTLVIDGTESVTGLVARAHELFPRLYREPEISRTITLGSGTSISGFDRSDVTGTVRSYLQQQLTEDPDAEQVLALADELLASDELALQLAHDSEGAAP
jgi:exonuclease SbcD